MELESTYRTSHGAAFVVASDVEHGTDDEHGGIWRRRAEGRDVEAARDVELVQTGRLWACSRTADDIDHGLQNILDFILY